MSLTDAHLVGVNEGQTIAACSQLGHTLGTRPVLVTAEILLLYSLYIFSSWLLLLFLMSFLSCHRIPSIINSPVEMRVESLELVRTGEVISVVILGLSEHPRHRGQPQYCAVNRRKIWFLFLCHYFA